MGLYNRTMIYSFSAQTTLFSLSFSFNLLSCGMTCKLALSQPPCPRIVSLGTQASIQHKNSPFSFTSQFTCVCVCVCEKERSAVMKDYICVWAYMCDTKPTVILKLAASLHSSHDYDMHWCVKACASSSKTDSHDPLISQSVALWFPVKLPVSSHLCIIFGSDSHCHTQTSLSRY